jgi:hypothetical protein
MPRRRPIRFRAEARMTFHVGQKVVCIKAEHDPSRFDWEKLPRLDAIYCVRWTDGETVRLAEIVNRLYFYEEGLSELRFNSWRFRPIVETKTDISIFTKMLTPKRVTA